MPPIVVIGIGADGAVSLSKEALDFIANADVLAGGKRHIGFFPSWQGESISIEADIDPLIIRLKEHFHEKKVVVLASGDPLFFGIGRVLLAAFPKDDLFFIPHISSIQLAFSKIKESWDDAAVVSVHGRSIDNLLHYLGRSPKIAVLTDTKNTPDAIGNYIIKHKVEDYKLVVCESLGSAEERITEWTADTVRGQSFSPLNVVILIRKQTADSVSLPLLGLPDEAFHVHAGIPRMVTKQEIRVVAISYLNLQPESIVWDVGAGSGSVSIEMARMSNRIRVYALEQDPHRFSDLKENIRRFEAYNVVPVEGAAPEIFSNLPTPDAVFIGGSDQKLNVILSEIAVRLKPLGQIVMNTVTLENLSVGFEQMKRLKLNPSVTSIQLAHSGALGRYHTMKPDHPLFIIRGQKRHE